MNGEWRPIPGYENRYEVSSEGRVRSLWNTHGTARPTPKVLAASPTDRGYPMVHLCDTRGRVGRYVHELVLTTFVGPRPEGHEASHLNGVRTDNRLVNLVWEPGADNNRRRLDHGTDNAGERSGHAILTEAAVVEIRHRYAAGATAPVLASEFGTTRQNTYDVVRGKTWRHVGGPITRNRYRRRPSS